MHNNFEENKKIALYVVNFVSVMYHLGDGVLVEFHPASRFPNPEVTAMVTSDYRILYNIDRLKVAPDYELYITSFHEMRHIYQHCCVDFRNKVRFSKYFKEPRERVLQWKKEFAIISNPLKLFSFNNFKRSLAFKEVVCIISSSSLTITSNSLVIIPNISFLLGDFDAKIYLIINSSFLSKYSDVYLK